MCVLCLYCKRLYHYYFSLYQKSLLYKMSCFIFVTNIKILLPNICMIIQTRSFNDKKGREKMCGLAVFLLHFFVDFSLPNRIYLYT